MYTDTALRVSGSLTATAAAFTDGVPSGYPEGDQILDDAVSADTIDIQNARDIGEGRKLYAVITVTAACTDGGAVSVTFSVISSANANLSSETILASSAAIPKADLVVGKQIVIEIPPVIAGTGQRYLGIDYAFSASATTGKYIADFVLDIQDGLKNYDSGFSVT